MMKTIMYYSYYIATILFLASFILVLLIKPHINSAVTKVIIDYFFWYFFGVFSGFTIVKWIMKHGNKKQQ